MKVKICGIATREDARFCATLGVDFIGLVFVPGSPRLVNPRQAARLVEEVRMRTSDTRIVGVFQDESEEAILRTARETGIDFVQLHGDESPDILGRLGLPVIKAFRPGAIPADSWAGAAWFLFDGRDGGSGSRFDWSLIPRPTSRPFLLAGGLSPDNVLEAIEKVSPDGVDISSGVEREPGRKDHTRIMNFVEKVRSV